jgi:hypothetical protein
MAEPDPQPVSAGKMQGESELGEMQEGRFIWDFSYWKDKKNIENMNKARHYVDDKDACVKKCADTEALVGILFNKIELGLCHCLVDDMFPFPNGCVVKREDDGRKGEFYYTMRSDKLPEPCEREPFTQVVNNRTIHGGSGTIIKTDTNEECSKVCATPRTCRRDDSGENCGAAVYNNASKDCTCYNKSGLLSA